MRSLIAGGIVLFAVSPETALTEVWRCKNKHSTSYVYTETPAPTPDEPCIKSEVEDAPFNKVPAEAFFPRVNSVQNENKDENNMEKSSRRGKLVDEPSKLIKEIHSTLAYKEVNTSKKTSGRKSAGRNANSEHGFSFTCEVNGIAKGLGPGLALLSVVRGALTVHSEHIQIKPNYQPVSWSMHLIGRCRKPTVELKWVG